MKKGFRKFLLIYLVLTTALTGSAYAFGLRALLEWSPRRVSKELWGVRVRTTLINDIKTDLSKFERIEILEFENEILELAPLPLKDKLTKSVAAAIDKLKLFREVKVVGDSQGETMGSPQAKQATDTLVVKGALVDYYQGHRLLRLVEGGLDTGTVVIHVRLLNKNTAEEIGELSLAGDLVSASWGKADVSIPKHLANKFARLIKEHYQVKKRT